MPKNLFNLLFICTFSFNASSFEKGKVEYPEELTPLYDEYRTCILAYPDSCSLLTDELFQKALSIKHYHTIAKAVLIRGIGYAYSNDLSKAIETFMQAEKIAEKLEPSDILADSRNNIANMYISQGDSTRAMKYFLKGREAAELMGSEAYILSSDVQILGLLISSGDQSGSIELMEEIEANIDDMGINMRAYFYIMQSQIYRKMEAYDSALEKSILSHEIYSEQEDIIGVVSSNYEIGMGYYYLGDTKKAIAHCLQGEKSAEENDLSLWKGQNCECLWLAYKKDGNTDKALSYLEKKNLYEEEVKNDDRIRQLTALEVESEFEKIRFQDSLRSIQNQHIIEKENELVINKAETKVQFLLIGLCSFLIILFLLFRQIKNKKKDNLIIKNQHDAIELKQEEILDSINYAKRLQQATLPSEQDLNKMFNDFFVLYNPKDLVSGDFYWMQPKTLSNGKEITFFALADCTGHGVPGAMVSIICSNALSRVAEEVDTNDPSIILEMVNTIVQDSFDTAKEEISDGMDISLIAIDKESQLIYFSGANNSLYLLTENSVELEDQKNFKMYSESNPGNRTLMEIKGTRRPVGRFHKEEPFLSHEVKFSLGDTVYMTSDGYIDQFGGDKNKSGKKFKKRQLIDLIVDISDKPMLDQYQILNDTHTTWKGNFEQTDDVCIVGIKF